MDKLSDQLNEIYREQIGNIIPKLKQEKRRISS